MNWRERLDDKWKSQWQEKSRRMIAVYFIFGVVMLVVLFHNLTGWIY